MIRFIAKRLGSGLVVLFVVSALTFFLLYISSGSIARNILGDQATAEQVALKEHELGLDQPLVTRYFTWLARCPERKPWRFLVHLGTGGQLPGHPDSGDHDHGFRRNDPDRHLRRTHRCRRRGQARLGGQGGPGWRHHRRLRFPGS